MSQRKVIKAIVAVGVASVVAKLFLMLRDLVIASSFGVSSEVDVFFLASLYRMHIVNVIAGSLAIAFVPRLIQIEETDGAERAKQFARYVTGLSTGILLVTTLLSGLVMPVAGPYVLTRDHSLSLYLSLFWIMAPALFLSGLATVWTGILTAREKYIVPTLIPIISPLLLVVFLPLIKGEARIYWLAWSTTFGALLELLVTTIIVYRKGYSLSPTFRFNRETRNGLIADLWPLAFSASILTLFTLIPQSWAAQLGPGSVSVLSYAQKITSLVAGIAGFAIATVTQPYFSRLIAQQNWAQLRLAVNRISALAFLVLGMMGIAIALGGEPLVRLLFQRGAFTAADTARVVPVQALYALQIPFAALTLAQYRLISALNARRLLWLIPALGVFVIIVLSFVLAGKMGVQGLALSVTIAQVFSALFYWLVIVKKLIPRSDKPIVSEMEIQPISS